MGNHAGQHASVRWVKSSYSSGDAQCVETAVVAGGRLVRDSKLGDASPVLAVSAGEWSSFTAKLKSGGLDQA
ncbi:uncharacterized protein DUF397 [Saccharopolyspora dendranthemae]|uniref:Uncharacterized protein DUF397 n=1 Tax=Saccharopolyspora dendranthemae TaxID=1181886 RepID=A0A561U735_9PSEU|nr:uncharacterized protein DUF397 [Saccharopolyspora dendranthemae]